MIWIEFCILGAFYTDKIGALRSLTFTVKSPQPANKYTVDKINNITITPISTVFLFHPKFWSILDWLFSLFWPARLTTDKMRCRAHSEKRTIWLPKTGNAGKVINLNSRRIEYLQTKTGCIPNIPRKFWRLVAVRCAENCSEVTLHRSEGWLRAIWSPTSEQQSSGSER